MDGMNLADIAAVTDRDNGFGGNGGMWIFALLILLMLGGGGFWNNRTPQNGLNDPPFLPYRSTEGEAGRR